MSYRCYHTSCDVCGKRMFIETQGGRDRRYCSPACKQAAYRKRKDGAKRNNRVLRNENLLARLSENGFSEAAMSKLRDILGQFGPDATQAAADLALLCAEEVRQLLRR